MLNVRQAYGTPWAAVYKMASLPFPAALDPKL